MSRPRLLDLFCGAGGCSVGYHRAGFDCVGVDNRPMPRYPFEFHQGEALEFLEEHGREFDVIHASPPCQAYTLMRNLGKGAGLQAPDLVGPTREALQATSKPWVIENVIGSPLKRPYLFCGSYFDLDVRRHRLFEMSNRLRWEPWCRHDRRGRPIAVYGDHPQGPGKSEFRAKAKRINRARSLEEGRKAMGIEWMTWPELTQAIPPAYTFFIGRQLRDMLE